MCMHGILNLKKKKWQISTTSLLQKKEILFQISQLFFNSENLCKNNLIFSLSIIQFSFYFCQIFIFSVFPRLVTTSNCPPHTPFYSFSFAARRRWGSGIWTTHDSAQQQATRQHFTRLTSMAVLPFHHFNHLLLLLFFLPCTTSPHTFLRLLRQRFISLPLFSFSPLIKDGSPKITRSLIFVLYLKNFNYRDNYGNK